MMTRYNRRTRLWAIGLALCLWAGLAAACSSAPAAPPAQAEQRTTTAGETATAPASATPTPLQSTQPENGIREPRRVVVTGVGEIAAQPDTATVRVGVVTEAVTATTALQQNSARIQAVLDQLKADGITGDEVQTSMFSISPSYGEQGREITGYRVENTVAVTVKDIQRVGAVLDATVQAGANQIYGISFKVADREQLMAQARQQAIENARTLAEDYARAAGASLGTVLVISEGGAPVAPVEIAGTAAGTVPVQPGEETIRVAVQVTYALE